MGKRVRRKPGDYLAVPLESGDYCFARVLTEPFVAFYEARAETPAFMPTIPSSKILFTIAVMNNIITKGEWPVVGHEPLSEELLVEPLLYKCDAISGAYYLYRDSTNEEIPATKEECENYEEAAVWVGWEVVERLDKHFAR